MYTTSKLNDKLAHLKANFKIRTGQLSGNQFQELDGYIERINAFNDQKTRLSQKDLVRLDKAMDKFDQLSSRLEAQLDLQVQ